MEHPLTTIYHAASFRPGQHRSEAWQAPRGHHMVHIETTSKTHAMVVPKDCVFPVSSARAIAAKDGIAPHHVATDWYIVDPDLIDIIK